ncbi:hypothetical protein Tco_0663998 [Tanacetum coccineum]
MSVGEKLKATSLDSTFRRKPRGGIEQSQYEELVHMVSSTTLIPNNDRYVWSLDNLGCFSVASLREVIHAKRYVGGKSSKRWVKYVARKIKLDAISTRINMSRHGIDLDSLSCPISETLHEMDSKSALSVIKVQFERFINSDLLNPLDIYSRSFSSDRELQTSTSARNLEATFRFHGKDSEVLPAESCYMIRHLEQIPYDTSDPANRFCPNGEETVTLEKESRSKLDKDKVKPYDYTYQNSLYETFKPPSKTYLDQLERAKEVRKTMWRKTSNTVQKPKHMLKNVSFLPISKSISKSRQVYNEMTNNFNHFRTICQQTWSNHTNSAFPNPTAKSMEVLIKTLLMPLSDKTILDSHCFVHELKKEMHDDLEYVKSLKKELDELESEKDDFSNISDLLLERVMCLKMFMFRIVFSV